MSTAAKIRSIVGAKLTTGEREVLYLVPVCERCGHSICPCCDSWCDACFDRDFDDDVEGPDFHPECAETYKCIFDGEVEKVGPIYGMDLPPWLEKQQDLKGEIGWLKRLLREALQRDRTGENISQARREALELMAKDDDDER